MKEKVDLIMDDYIRRQETIMEIKSRISTANDAWESGYNTAMAEAAELIKHIPSADVQPAKHGRWLPHKITASSKCSECNRVFADETPHCPNCGCKQDLGGD
jgi:hypothetical protein